MPASSELIEFSLPCETCAATVTIRSDNPRDYIDRWLDSEVTIRCSVHRARNGDAA